MGSGDMIALPKDVHRTIVRQARVRLLDFPDGSPAACWSDLEADLAIAQDASPRLVLSLAENGHANHCAIARAAIAVVRKLRRAGLHAELWQAVWVRELLASPVGRWQAVRETEHLLQVDVRHVTRAKRRGILCHRSQLTWKNRIGKRLRALWSREYFLIAAKQGRPATAGGFEFQARSTIT
jgi:LmbE family N-acetylglucosaminyl deacetylase